MSLEDELRALPGSSGRPDWEEIEWRATKLRRRRHTIRGVVAVGALIAVLGATTLLADDGPATTTDRNDVAAPDGGDATTSSTTTITTTTTVDIAARACDPDEPIVPSVDPESEIALFFAEMGVTGVARIPFPPDCSIEAFADAVALNPLPGDPHADLPVFDGARVQIGVIVYGLPPMTVEEYEADPEGHRARGLQRMQELETLSTDSTPNE